MSKKRILSLVLVVAMLMVALAACAQPAAKTEEPATTEAAATEEKTEAAETEAAKTEAEPAAGGTKKVAVFYYKYGDTYISTVRQALADLVAADANIELSEFDGQDDQAKQNDQIDAAIEKGVDILVVNIVDMGAAATVIEKAKAADLPLVFFNREPTDGNVYSTYEKARFVGTKIEEAGVLQGELIKKYWDLGEHDRNGNGVLDYVLLHGGITNNEAVARSEYSVKTLADNGIEVNEIAQQIADWDNSKAMAAMEAWLAKDADNIDVVIANNDEMALGALTALQAEGFNLADEAGKFDPAKYVGVFGVDAIEVAQTELDKGTMAGTVKQDADAMAKALNTLIGNTISGKEFIEGTEYEYDESGIAVRIPYVPYVPAN